MEADDESGEDLLKPGHLTRLMEEDLAADVDALCVREVNAGLERLLSRLRAQRDSCQPQLQVPTTDGLLSQINSVNVSLKHNKHVLQYLSGVCI